MEHKIHIQHLLLSLQPGGLENGVVNIVNRLNPARFRSSVCCLKHAGEFAPRLAGNEVAIHQMGWLGGNDLLLPLKLARLFRRTKTDIVHTRNAEAFFYGFLGARIAGLPRIRIIHSEHGRTFNDRPLRFTVQRLFSRYTDRIFSVTEQLKQDLVRHISIPADRIEVLYNGVDLGRFKPVSRMEIRARLGFQTDDRVVGSVGRLVAVKNYPLLLQAIGSLGLSHVKLALVGEGPERGALEKMVAMLGLQKQVLFLGHCDNVAELLAAFEVFVLPSFSEGMSNTLLEAMGAGIAVVASDVGGNPEIVRDGIDGLLFPSRDETALASRLLSLLRDDVLRIQLAHAGRERVLRDFTMDAMISRYENLYESAFADGTK